MWQNVARGKYLEYLDRKKPKRFRSKMKLTICGKYVSIKNKKIHKFKSVKI